MYTRVDICTCDICKKRMSKPIWMKDYGSVTIIKESDESPITVEPLMFKDICAECLCHSRRSKKETGDCRIHEERGFLPQDSRCVRV